ncbi:MAG: tRNA (guanine(46)-N(7))-methyltransferase TrmB [Rickettsiales bacterium]|jgi:tRNA (guanine-N7-)-methyltransferase|nr:tRNA (guanine(46)-N(7))-methyltransferase TrmB [Rickettsiales bacterium]
MENQEIKTFGRRYGKKLSARQQWLVENLLPAFLPKNNEKAGKNTMLEIGFGSGEHLRELALANPDSIIIGAEPFINGVASLLSAMTDDKNEIKPEYQNIRIWPEDVRKLLNNNDLLRTMNFAFDKIYVLHPDPWPKARHEKRRLLSAEFLNLLAKRLAPDGEIVIGTDHYGYFDWILEQAKKTKLKYINIKAETIITRYQKKNKARTESPKYLALSAGQNALCAG